MHYNSIGSVTTQIVDIGMSQWHDNFLDALSSQLNYSHIYLWVPFSCLYYPRLCKYTLTKQKKYWLILIFFQDFQLGDVKSAIFTWFIFRFTFVSLSGLEQIVILKNNNNKQTVAETTKSLKRFMRCSAQEKCYSNKQHIILS